MGLHCLSRLFDEKCSNISNTSLSVLKKVPFIRGGIHKMVVRTAIRGDTDLTAFSEAV